MTNLETTRVEPARPFAGKPSWRALYLQGTHWRYVTNAAGGIILYASEDAAQKAAQYMREKWERE